MDNLPEKLNSTNEDVSNIGTKSYKTALRVLIIGGIISFSLLILAILTLFTEGGDSAGPGVFIFGFLALAVFATSCFISLIISVIGLIKGTVSLSQNKNLNNEVGDGLAKNITLILGIILVVFIAYKLLT
jgi:hypothetical protein